MISKGSLVIYLTLASILIVSFYLRVHDLANNPPGFYTDEASIGFNAYKILTTGRDEHGKFLPVFFEAFGEYKNPLAIYPVVPSIAIFGLSEFAVRVVQAIWGLMTVAIVFFLGREMFGTRGGILSAFILGISPWHIHLSRFNIESHGAFLFFICGGLLFTLISMRKNWSRGYLVLSALFWGLSFYTYFATRIFTPLFLLGLLIIFSGELVPGFKKYGKKFIFPVLVFLLVVSLFAFHVVSGKAFLRFKQVAFNRQDQQINIVSKSLRLYAEHFDPKFVFLLGDSDYPGQKIVRHSLTGMALFYKWQMPLFLVGLIYLVFIRNKKWGFKIRNFLVLMLLLYPLGSVVSDAETPYATRSVIGVIPYTLIITLGVLACLSIIEKLKPYSFSIFAKISFLTVFAYLSIFFLLRFEALSKAYINVASGYNGFQYGTRDAVNFFLSEANNFDMFILYSGVDGGDAYLKFYSKGRCAKCYISDDNRFEGTRKLMAVSAESDNDFYRKYEGKLLKIIIYPNGRDAFRIYDARRLD